MRRLDFIVVLALALLGGLVFVESMDDVYRENHTDVTVVMPDALATGNPGSIAVMATDMNGDPVEGEPVVVEVIGNGSSSNTYLGITGSDGLAFIDMLGFEDEEHVIIDVTVNDKTFRNYVFVEKVPIRTFIIQTDKPIYQPGQDVHMRFLTYLTHTREPATEPVLLEIFTPEGDKVLKEELKVTEYGVSNFDYPLSNLLPLGDYKIKLTQGEESYEGAFLVDRYVLPKFILTSDGLDSWYMRNGTVSFDILANYSFGKPITGTMDIEVSGYNSDYESMVGMANLSGELTDGVFHVELDMIYDRDYYSNDTDPIEVEGYAGEPTALIYGGGRYYWYGPWIDHLIINATVTDEGGHTEMKSFATELVESPLKLTTVGDWDVVGYDSTYWLIASYPDGAPAQCTITVDLYDMDYWYYDYGYSHMLYIDAYDRPYYESDPVKVGTRTIETDQRGLASISFGVNSSYYMMKIHMTDGEAEASYNLQRWAPTGGIKVIPNELSYTVGDTASFTLLTQSQGGTYIYNAYVGGIRVRSGRFKLDVPNGGFSFPVEPGMAPGLEVRVSRVDNPYLPATTGTFVNVNDPESLVVWTIPSVDTVKPGEDISVDINVESHGYPVDSAIGVRIVDSSVYELVERISMNDLYPTNNVYPLLNYLDGGPRSVPKESFISHSKSYDTTVGAYINSDAGADELRDSGFGAVLAASSAVFLLIVVAFSKRGHSRVSYGLLAVGLVIVPASLVYGPSFEAEEAGEEDFYDQGSSDAIALTDGDAFMITKEGAPSDSAWTNAPGGARDDDVLEFQIGLDGGFNGSSGSQIDGPKNAPRLRKYFPETWYWNPLVVATPEGGARIDLTAPDTITTWKMDVVASTKDMRIGSGELDIVVFQEFFVEPDIPEEVVRNDTFPLRMMVYNYLEEEQKVDVTLEDAEWFELLNETTQSIDVPAQSVSYIDFHIIAREVGTHKVNVLAESKYVADQVLKDVRVAPNGDARTTVQNGDIENSGTFTEQFSFDRFAVPGSTSAYVKLAGGLEAVIIDGAEEFINFVYGCGEQSTSLLSSNTAAYKHLMKTDPLPEDVQEWNEKMIQGIQHWSQYIVSAPNGARALSWHHEGPDLWLTAWSVQMLKDLKDIGWLNDDYLLADFQDYLMDQADFAGSYKFPNIGHWSVNSVLENDRTAATAYVVNALLYSGVSPEDPSIMESLQYIQTKMDKDGGAFHTSLILLALQRAGIENDDVGQLIAHLEDLAINEDGMIHWEMDPDDVTYWWRSTTWDIETTAFAVMAMGESGDMGLANEGIKYLVNSRESGCWGSTHSTAVSLQAINNFGSRGDIDMVISVKVDGVLVDTVTLNNGNREVMNFIDLEPYMAEGLDHEVVIESNGKGLAFYQVISEHYIPWDRLPGSDPDINLTVEFSNLSIRTNEFITAHVRVAYEGERQRLRMVLLELEAPTSLNFDESEFLELKAEGSRINGTTRVGSYEIGEGHVLVYIDDLTAGDVLEFNYTMTPTTWVSAQIQGIQAWDMYNTEMRTVVDPVWVWVRDPFFD